MKIYSTLFLLLFFLGYNRLNAQNLPKGIAMEYSVYLGKPFKHRSYITVDFSKPSFGTEFNFEIKTYGKKHWHQRAGYPRWGLALTYQHSGNEAQMGSAIAVLPNITIDFFKKDKIRIFGRLGVGLGLITKPYDPINNPLNNVIGSYINNTTTFRLGAAWRFAPHLEFRPSAAFSHYSNAASTLPNLGINIISFQLGVAYISNPLQKKDYIKYKKGQEPILDKRIQFSYTATLGIREMETSSGPKYLIGQTSLDAGLFITKSNRLKAGIEYDYIGSVYAFMRNNGGYSNKNLHWQASRISLYLADEIMIGRFSVLIQAGFYVTQNPFQPWFMSFRLSGRYYFLDPYLHPIAPFVVITMKSHKIVAEYFSLGFGTTF